MSLVIWVGTRLISQAPDSGPDPGGSVSFQDVGRGQRGGRKGTPTTRGGGGQGAVPWLLRQRGPCFRTFVDVKP